MAGIIHQDPNRNRVRMFNLSEDFFLNLILSDKNYKIKTKLPQDVIIRNIDFHPDILGFRILVQSSEFPEKHEGETLEFIPDAVVMIEWEEYYKQLTDKLTR